MTRGWTDSIDRRLLTALSRHARQDGDITPSRAATAARDITALGGDTLRIVFLLGCMIGLFADGRAATAWLLLLIFASARIALYVLKALVRRPRPDPAGHGVVTYTTSFPSGHSFMAASLFLAAALLIPDGQPLGQIAVALATSVSLLVAATRLVFGIHWPSDVAVGWLGGAAWATGWLLADSMWLR